MTLLGPRRITASWSQLAAMETSELRAWVEALSGPIPRRANAVEKVTGDDRTWLVSRLIQMRASFDATPIT